MAEPTVDVPPTGAWGPAYEPAYARPWVVERQCGRGWQRLCGKAQIANSGLGARVRTFATEEAAQREANKLNAALARVGGAP